LLHIKKPRLKAQALCTTSAEVFTYWGLKHYVSFNCDRFVTTTVMDKMWFVFIIQIK
jgi:hypothetical protein